MIIHHLDDAILTFNQSGTAFHPITAIVIRNAAELPDRRAVYVTAQHSVNGKFLGVMAFLNLTSLCFVS